MLDLVQRHRQEHVIVIANLALEVLSPGVDAYYLAFDEGALVVTLTDLFGNELLMVTLLALYLSQGVAQLLQTLKYLSNCSIVLITDFELSSH